VKVSTDASIRLVPSSKYTGIYSWHQALASLDGDSGHEYSDCQLRLSRSSPSSDHLVWRSLLQTGRQAVSIVGAGST
jgi:hypothetical protein